MGWLLALPTGNAAPVTPKWGHTGRAATLETENQRLFFNRTHENDHAAYGTSQHILFLLFKLNCHCSLRIWIQAIAPPTLSLI